VERERECILYVNKKDFYLLHFLKFSTKQILFDFSQYIADPCVDSDPWIAVDRLCMKVCFLIILLFNVCMTNAGFTAL
jgi:hypothetical protein